MGMSACEPALCPHDPTQEPVSVSYTELLLGDAEEFGV